MSNPSDQKHPRSKNNFKELKNFILTSAGTDIESVAPSFSQHFNPQGSLKLEHPSLKLNSKTYTSKNSTKDSTFSRRLNLKEYLHLNSIEKKAKSRSYNKGMKGQPDSAVLSAANSLQLRNADEDSMSRRQNSQVYCCEVLKGEVQKKIEQEIQRLQELSLYFQQEYEEKENEKQSELFLFDVLKGLQKTSKGHDEIGEKVWSYEGEARDSPKKKEYYWCREKKVLQSPARMKNAYELTVNAFEVLTRAVAREPPK